VTLTAVAQATYTCPTEYPRPAFDCPVLPPPPEATNVNELRFGNIGAVLAFGDSMTAGFAVKDLPVEYRGDVYSTGGDSDSQSVGFMLQKNYNPNLIGQAWHGSVPLDPFCVGLNCAISGGVVADIPIEVDMAVHHLKGTFKNASDVWKLATLFIGANDACGCTSPNSSPYQWETKMRAALGAMHMQLPKTFVNVMTLFNISGVWDLDQTTPKCKLEVQQLHECSCLYTNATKRQEMDDLIQVMNAITYKVAAEFQAMKDPLFTVSVQPGVQGMNIATMPENFLSDVDCFHPSLCAHQGFSLALWNNMQQAPGNKTSELNWKNAPPFMCPTADTFVQ
jgi:lysophospholipase L1-like esterase